MNFPVLMLDGGSSMVTHLTGAITTSTVGVTVTTPAVSTVVTLGMQVSSASVSHKQKTSAGGVKHDWSGASKPSATPFLNYLEEVRPSQLLPVSEDTVSHLLM